ncbi:MAG TPA: IclR family transcriptional regulator [Solirubrobacteraceae bacterium]|jgi:DNA-binding IclR family transcriptional regulator|nr:IclR family transcriptional regulator [Solirubrobacteraceae bacterium]
MDDAQESSQRGRHGRRGGRPRTPRSDAPPPRIAAAPDPRRSRSLEYGIALLESYSGKEPALGIAELAERVRISRSTTHRYAMTLVALGYLEQDAKRKYHLSQRAGQSGQAAIEALRCEVKGRAVLEELRAEVGHTVSMAVLSGPRAIYVYRLFAHRRGQYEVDRGVGTGASVPLHCSAVGKALLAGLPAGARTELIGELELAPGGPNAIRDRGALERALQQVGPGEPVLDDEEQLAGARSLAVLVPRPPEALPLAIAVSAPAAAYGASRMLKQVGPRLRRAARLIGAD